MNNYENELLLRGMQNDIINYSTAVRPKFRAYRFHEALGHELQMAFEGKNKRLMIFAPPRHGKLLNNNTKLVYKNLNGDIIFGKHGDLKAGYQVLHYTGEFYPVLETKAPMKMNRKVTFSTGETISTHADHLWEVRDSQESRNKHKDVWKVVDTQYLQDHGLMTYNTKAGSRGSRYRWQVRPIQEAEFNTDDIDDAYWLGYWLGDGRSEGASIYIGSSDYEVGKAKLSEIYPISSETKHKETGVYNLYFGFSGVRKKIPVNEKHIPDQYKFGSVKTRKELLAGLIDSDGHVDQKTGRVRFVNTNIDLVEGVAFVARSLGFKATITSVPPTLSSSGVQGSKVVYTVSIFPTSDLPTIYERKRINKLTKNRYNSIVNIEEYETDEEGFCIVVGSPDHTYVVGETFINTHNTFMTSELAPAWFMGKFPDKKIIAASHTMSLAERNGSIVRDIIASPVHQQIFGTAGSLNPKYAAAGNFRTNAGGEYAAVGVGGSPIGKGADIYIIDDPIRNRKDVESEQQREDLKEWYSSSVVTRLEGDGVIILMHQRWHEDDLAGYLLRERADAGWRVINFPALIEDEEDYMSDYLQRDYDEALCPELKSREQLEFIRDHELTPRDWLSMYQQKPRGSDGDEFTEGMIQRYTKSSMEVGSVCNKYIIVDPANSKKKGADFTTMAVIGLGPDNNFYILDMIRDHLDLTERAEALISLHRQWRPIITAYEQYGAQADIQHIRYVQEQTNYRFPITQIGYTGQQKLKKEERIRRLVPDMSSGRWYAPDSLVKISVEGKEYEPIEDMIKEEMIPFPVGKHDDAIDAISRIYDLDVITPSAINNNHGKIKSVSSPW